MAVEEDRETPFLSDGCGKGQDQARLKLTNIREPSFLQNQNVVVSSTEEASW